MVIFGYTVMVALNAVLILIQVGVLSTAISEIRGPLVAIFRLRIGKGLASG